MGFYIISDLRYVMIFAKYPSKMDVYKFSLTRDSQAPHKPNKAKHCETQADNQTGIN